MILLDREDGFNSLCPWLAPASCKKEPGSCPAVETSELDGALIEGNEERHSERDSSWVWMLLARLSRVVLKVSAGGKENFSESCETTEVRQSMLKVFSESFFAIGSRTTGGIERRSVASTNIAGSLLALSRASKATIISPRMATFRQTCQQHSDPTWVPLWVH